MIRLSEIQTTIDKAAQRYYRDGSAVMSDAAYDSLIAELRVLNPDDERLSRVGIPYNADEIRTKVQHPIPMGSLDNIDGDIAGYPAWINKFDGTQVCASLKIDGSSIRLRYVRGKLVQAATRGNGSVGEDITANVANFRGVPTVLDMPLDLDIRGEAVLYVAEYQSLKSAEYGVPYGEIPEKDRSNPRNIGNGIISREDGTNSHLMQFLAFNVEGFDGSSDAFFKEFTSIQTEADKFRLLKTLGFKPVPYKVCDSVEDVEQFYATTAAARSDLPFEIDGIVVVLNSLKQQAQFITSDEKTRLRPKYARAIKLAVKSNVTKLVGVDITVGHTGAIIPTAIFQEVRVGGVNVTHALLNNWNEIARLDVAIGDMVEVVLSGDIIPRVEQVVERATDRKYIHEPSHCPSCASPTSRVIRGVSGAVTYCTRSQTCSEAMFQKIKHWVGTSKKGVGILGIGDAVLRALWDSGLVKNPADLYVIIAEEIQDLIMVSGGKFDSSGYDATMVRQCGSAVWGSRVVRSIRIGDRRAAGIISNIRSKMHLTLPVFLGSLGIELLGRRRVKMLQESAGGQLDILEDWLDESKFSDDGIKVEGLGDTIRTAIRDGIKSNLPLIKDLIANGITIDYPAVVEKSSSGTLEGLSFCFTGTRECIDEVVALGATIKSSVAASKPSPDYLVQKDPMSKSNKSKNAESNGHTQIISLDFLKSVIAGKAVLS